MNEQSHFVHPDSGVCVNCGRNVFKHGIGPAGCQGKGRKAMANFLRQLGMFVVVVMFIITALAIFTKQMADTPIVQMSWSSQLCLQVFSPDKAHNCNNLPERFMVEWVR